MSFELSFAVILAILLIGLWIPASFIRFRQRARVAETKETLQRQVEDFTRRVGAGIAVYGALVIAVIFVSNGIRGEALDGSGPPEMTASEIDTAYFCPASDLSLPRHEEVSDQLQAVGYRPLIPVVVSTCEGKAARGVVRVHSCDSDPAKCWEGKDPKAGNTHLECVDGVVLSADLYIRGRLDTTMHGDGGQERTYKHEVLHVLGVGVDKNCKLVHARGATNLMSVERGPSMRGLDCVAANGVCVN